MLNIKHLACCILFLAAAVTSQAQTPNYRLPVKTYHFEDTTMIGKHQTSYRAHVELPVGKGVMMDSIMSWVHQLFTSNEKSNISKILKDDAKAYFAKTKDELYEDEEEESNVDYSLSMSIRINVTSQTPSFCTFRVVGYDYFGGAHGMPYKYGVTFCRKDGHMLSWSDFTGNAKSFSPVITKYCDGESLNVINMMVDGTLQQVLPPPSANPWIEGDDIVFSYGAYEVGSYAQGMPESVVPVSAMPNTLSPSIRALCKTYTDAINARTTRYAWKGKMGSNISFSIDLQENADGIIAGCTTYYRKNGKTSRIPVYGHREKGDEGTSMLYLNEFEGNSICGSYFINTSGKNFNFGTWFHNATTHELNSITPASPSTSIAYLHPVESPLSIAPYYSFQYETGNPSTPVRNGECELYLEDDKVQWRISQLGPDIAEVEGESPFDSSCFSNTKGNNLFKAYVDKYFVLITPTNPDAPASGFSSWTTFDGIYVRTPNE